MLQVGDDEFGHMLVDILKKNGVNSEGVCFDAHARTALAFVTLKKNGEREFMFYRNPSADMLLTESELNMGLIKQAKIFHYGSISLISEPCRSAHMAAMKAAKEAGILLSYDPNVRLPLWPSAQAAIDGIKSIWNHADFIKVVGFVGKRNMYFRVCLFAESLWKESNKKIRKKEEYLGSKLKKSKHSHCYLL